MAKVVLEEVNKVYPNGFHAVHDLSIDIVDGEFLVLVGPSGCGKSTALRMIAGLESISSGKLMIGDRVVNDVPPKDRDIAFVFQNYALYPHMTVKENIGFALKLRRMSKEEIEQRVKEAAELLELVPVLDRKPGQLSGGQRQRVAMGRAIVRRPHVFLMDEPLSNLDAKLRVQMRAEISRLQHNLGVTTVYVTHDQVEAMTMGQRVAVLDAGYLQQIDTPQNLYDHPNNLFVATFIGSPQMNLVLAKVDLSGPSIDLGKHHLDLPAGVLERRPGLRQFDGAEVIVGIRPEDMEDATVADGTQGARTLPVKILLREGLGSEVVVHAQLDARAPQVKTAQAGDDAGVLLEGSGVVMIARLDPRTTVAIDQDATFVVDVERLHWFDPATGLAIYD